MVDNRKVVLLTGASGLLGSCVTSMVPDSCRLISIGRNSVVGLPTQVEHLRVDLSDPGLSQHLPSRIDTVIHLAQSRRFREFPQGAADVFAVNTHSTAILLNHAVKSGCKDFIYASTGGVYKPNSLLTELSPLLSFEDMQFYPASKLAAEALIGSYSKVLRVVVMRIFFMYGKGQHESMLVPRLINSILKGRPILISEPFGFRFNPLFSSDAAALVWALVNSNFSGVLNVAGPEELTLKNVGELIGTQLGISPKFDIISEKSVDFRVNLQLLKDNFSQIVTPFEVGLREIV